MAEVAAVLVNSHASIVLSDVLEPEAASFRPMHHMRTPKALLPSKGSDGQPAVSADSLPCMLDLWLGAVRKHGISRIFLVTNGAFYKHFERWATATGFPVDNIINDGTTTDEYAIGAAASLHILQRRVGVELRKFSVVSDSDVELGVPITLRSAVDVANAGEPDTRAASDEDLAANYRSYLGLAAPTTSAPSARASTLPAPTICRAHARVGVMGNPSDGFFGKTISLSIANYWAEVRLWPSARLTILPHPLYDPHSFGGLSDVHAVVTNEGYQGGVRLLLATCKRFYEYAKETGIELRVDNFTLAYDTNVPRQVGLAGSSAIITATVRALLTFHGVTEAALPLVQLPSLILSIEQAELGINAGLQDRVIQAYGGLVSMDFERAHLEAHGRGKYERLDLSLAPPLWLAYLADPSDSGKIHSTVKARYNAGDEEVVSGMREFASLTERALGAIRRADMRSLGELMDANFALRRKLYSDGALGAKNLMMVAIAQKHGVPVKFPGSGGAVVGLCVSDEAMEAMRHELERNGCVFTRVVPNPPVPA